VHLIKIYKSFILAEKWKLTRQEQEESLPLLRSQGPEQYKKVTQKKKKKENKRIYRNSTNESSAETPLIRGR
jgi:hypothetical protein